MPIQNRNDQLPETKNGGAKLAISSASDDIRRDLNSLQSDVVILASDIKKVGATQARAAVDYVTERVDTLKATGNDALVKIEDGIKSKPGQSVTIAFAAGLLVSFLLGRRS
jgi:ElaB/YqjD/DUF883 family membrane-anchored ribosome-binding protein